MVRWSAGFCSFVSPHDCQIVPTCYVLLIIVLYQVESSSLLLSSPIVGLLQWYHVRAVLGRMATLNLDTGHKMMIIQRTDVY
jgi:hypothetical protein